ncbi:OsmC family protein [Kitasatospora sp. NPDC098663]|uniref:OsmC family protein n=1 Tax=Kitasatospora sp. NPDC098663 TaxID=3364096 RepID=UPI00381C2C06
MYAEREKWPPEAVRVRLGYETNGSHGPISRQVAPTGALDDARRARLLDVRDHTPVTLALRAGVAIDTTEDRV